MSEVSQSKQNKCTKCTITEKWLAIHTTSKVDDTITRIGPTLGHNMPRVKNLYTRSKIKTTRSTHLVHRECSEVVKGVFHECQDLPQSVSL